MTENFDINYLLENIFGTVSKEKYNDEDIYKIADKLLKLNNYKFITLRSEKLQKEMFMYSKKFGYYIPDGGTFIDELCSNNFTTSSKKFTEALKYRIQNKTLLSRELFIHPRHLINLKNGIFNLDTDELMEHSSEHYFRGMLNIIYDKEATCTNWEKELKGMFKSDEDRIRNQKWFGYQFTRENREQVAHGYFGESGSGKSQILKILRDLLGSDNVTSFQLQEFNNPNQYALGRLHEKYANICYDMSTAKVKDISIFKQLTGGDPIPARNIFKEPFEFINYAKLTWTCNKLPTISESDLNSIQFKRRVMLTEIVKGHKIDDKDIYYKFRNELPGIFNWAIEGYRMYVKDNGFKWDYNIVPEIWKNNSESNIIENKKTDKKTDKEKDKEIGNKVTIISDNDDLENLFRSDDY